MTHRVLLAKELVKRIREHGAFNFPESCIVGDVTLDLRGLNLPLLRFSGAWFRGKLTIKGGRIGKLRLDDATVAGELYISRATIGMQDVDTTKLMVEGKPFMQTALPMGGRDAGLTAEAASA